MKINKSILSLLFPFAFAFQNHKQIRIFQNEHFEVLNGRVKQLITSGFDTMGTPFLMLYTDTIIFDRDGDEKEIRSYKHDIYKSTKILNGIPKGKAYKVEEPFSNGGKSVSSYDADRKIKERSAYNNDGLFERCVYFYDELSRVIEIKTFDKSGVLHHKMIFKYDDNGLLAEEDHYPKSSGEYDSRIFYQYDSFDKNHNWLKQTKVTKHFGDTTSFRSDTVTRKISYY